MLYGEPFVPRPGMHILRRVNYAILDLILKLWLLHREGKGKVDGLFVIDLLLLYIFGKFDFLFVVKKPNCGRDGRRVRAGAFHARNRPVRGPRH